MIFPQLVGIWESISSAGLVQWILTRVKVSAGVYQKITEHFMLPSANNLYRIADFTFEQDLAPSHTANGTINYHGIMMFDGPATPSTCVLGNMIDTRPNNADKLKAVTITIWAS